VVEDISIMSGYTFSGIILAACALFIYFYFYQHVNKGLGIGPNASHQAETRALHQSGSDDDDK
jgi:hypothetical protein